MCLWDWKGDWNVEAWTNTVEYIIYYVKTVLFITVIVYYVNTVQYITSYDNL